MLKSCSPLIARVHRWLDQELADMVTHINQSVSVLNITPYGNIHEHYQEAKSAARFRAEVPKNSFVNGSGEGIFMYPIIVRENAVLIPTN